MYLKDEDIKAIVEFLQNIREQYNIKKNGDGNNNLKSALVNFINKYDLYKFKILINEERNNTRYIDISMHDGRTVYNVDSKGNVYKTRLYLTYK